MAVAKFCDVDDKDISEWAATCPPAIQDMIKTHPPGRLYRMKSTGHRVYIHSYTENSTVTVVVSGEFNLVAFDRQVFGIHLNDLDECDLPSPDEPLGSANLSIEEIRALVKRKQGMN